MSVSHLMHEFTKSLLNYGGIGLLLGIIWDISIRVRYGTFSTALTKRLVLAQMGVAVAHESLRAKHLDFVSAAVMYANFTGPTLLFGLIVFVLFDESESRWAKLTLRVAIFFFLIGVMMHADAIVSLSRPDYRTDHFVLPRILLLISSLMATISICTLFRWPLDTQSKPCATKV